MVSKAKNISVRVRVPASTSNLGPGFDAFGLALGLYAEVTFRLTDKPDSLEVTGEGEDQILLSEDNPVLQAASLVWQRAEMPRRGWSIRIENSIPLFSGLGSSGAATVAGLLAADALAGNPLSRNDLLFLATQLEGHPDNVVASLLGGFTIACQEQGMVHACAYPCPEKMRAVVLHPKLVVATHASRKALPREISREAAVFNIARAAQLAAAMALGLLDGIECAFDDALHQHHRSAQMPYLFEAIKAARKAGAWGAFLSGSGPSVAALCAVDICGKVAAELETIRERFSLEGKTMILPIDNQGARVIPCQD